MQTEGLLKVLGAICPLSEKFKKALTKELHQVSLSKDHLLLEAGNKADKAFFLQRGFIMSYSFEHGRKTTGEFWKAGQIVISCNSFFEQVTSRETIQLITACELLCIKFESVQRLFMRYPEATQIYRRIMNRYFDQHHHRLLDLLHLTAEQRLDKLLIAAPELEQLVTLDAIASYIGVTPQSLSRIRGRKRKNKI